MGFWLLAGVLSLFLQNKGADRGFAARNNNQVDQAVTPQVPVD